MIAALLPILAPLLGDVLKSILPEDPAKQREAEAAINAALISRSAEIEKAAASIIQTEAASEHWLAANWRPLMMLTFGGLIVARWLGWAAPNLAPEEYIKLWDIVELGLGGYVIGRSVEKIAPSIAGALKR